MGKKSRRQREVGGGVLQMKPERRFETDHWRHKDGSPIKTEEIKKLYRAVQVTGQLQGFEQAQEEDIKKLRFFLPSGAAVLEIFPNWSETALASKGEA